MKKTGNGFTVIEGKAKDYTDLTPEEIEKFSKYTEEEILNLPYEEYMRFLWYANNVMNGESPEEEREFYNKVINSGDIFEKVIARNHDEYEPRNIFEARQMDKLEQAILNHI